MTLDVILIKKLSDSGSKKVYIGMYEPSQTIIVSVYKNSDDAFREIYALYQVPDEISPELIDCKKIENFYFIVQEKIRGKPLSISRINEEIAYKVGRAMAEVHNSGVIHGDLHMGNILVTKDNNIKIIDWQYACIIPREIEEKNKKKYLAKEIFSISIDMKKYPLVLLRGYFDNIDSIVYDTRKIFEELKKMIMKFGNYFQRKVIQKLEQYFKL